MFFKVASDMECPYSVQDTSQTSKGCQVSPLKNSGQSPVLRLTVARQMADYRKRLAERLENEREGQSLSRETLALKAGVSDKTIKRIEEQKVDRPRPVTIRRLADALKVEPSDLAPPEELEADQLNRIEQKLDRLLAWAEKRTVQEIEAEFGLDEGQEPRQGERGGG